MDASITVRLINETQKGFSDINSSLTKIKSNLAGVAAAFSSAFAVGNLTKIANDVETLNNKLKLVSTSSEDFAKKYQTVFDVAQRTGQPLNELGDLYTKLYRAQDTAKISAEQVGRVTETFANILRVSGVTAGGASAAILQFSQAMQSGRLSGDEFRTILEQTPILLQGMAKALGVTFGELRKLAAEQKLSSEIVAKAMLLMEAEMAAAAATMNFTLSNAFTKVNNALQNSVKGFLEQSGAIDIANRAADYLVKNMDNILPILQLVGVALGAVAAVLVGPVVTGFAAAVAVAVAFADEVGPLAKTILKALGSALEFVVGQVMGFVGAIKEVIKGNFAGAMKAYEDGVNGVKKALDPTVKSQEALNKQAADARVEAIKGSAEYKKLQEEVNRLKQGIVGTTSEYGKFESKLQQQIKLAGEDEVGKKRQQLVYEGLKAKAKDLQKSVEQLTEAERKAVEQQVDGAMETIRAKEAESKAREDAYKKAVSLLDQYASEYRKANTQQLSDQDRFTQELLDIEDAYNQALINGKNLTAEELKKIESDYRSSLKMAQERSLLDLEKEYKKYSDKTLTDTEAFNKERKRLDDAYNRAGIDDAERYNQALENIRTKYGKKFKDMADKAREEEKTAEQIHTDKIKELNEAMWAGLIKSQEDYDAIRRKIDKDYIESTVKEYSNLYGLLNEKLLDWSGLTQKEYGIVKDVIKLTFGVDVEDLIKQFFAASIRYVLGFRTAAEQDVGFVGTVINKVFGQGGEPLTQIAGFGVTGIGHITGFGQESQSIFGKVGDVISSVFTGGLDFISAFVLKGLDLLKGFGSGAGSIFGKIGDFIGDIFGGGGGGIGDIFGDIIGGVGDIFGGAGSVIGDIFGGAGSVIGDIFGGIGDIFGGSDILGGIGDFFGDLFGGAGSAGGATSILSGLPMLAAGAGGLVALGDALGLDKLLGVGKYGSLSDPQFASTPRGRYELEKKTQRQMAAADKFLKEGYNPQQIAGINYQQAQQNIQRNPNGAFTVDYAVLGLPLPKGRSPIEKARLMKEFQPYAKAGVAFPEQWKGIYYYKKGGIVGSPTMFNIASGFGVAGEAGAEAILPLSRGSNGELGVNAMAGDVNVNFTINAVDAQGIDQLLIERKQFITNMVRSAVADKGKIGRYI